MRRAWLLLALATMAVASASAAAQTIAFGVGGQLTGEANGQVRVPVYADLRAASGVALGSYTLRLTWDPNVLYYESLDEGSFGQPTVGADSAYYGVLKVGGLSAGGVQGLTDLFAVNFSILSSQTTAVTLTVTEAIEAGTFADLTPQVTVVSGLYCPAVGRWGDLDGDGRANSRDALAILSAIVGLPLDSTFARSLGDVDGDGLVNSRDALITLSYAVGLEIPGQRVLLYAPGASCSSGMSNGVTILPDTVDVAVGQRVRLVMLGTVDGLPSGTSAEWQVANPDIAAVTNDGLLSGRAAGTTIVKVLLGPGITASAPVLVRARRGVWHVDAARATLAAVQLGTQRYPFATPQYAFPIAQEGDTVLVAPGVHDYLAGDLCTDYSGGGDTPPPGDAGSPPAPPPEDCVLYGYITRGVVLMGDTLADGTRPVLRGSRDNYTAIQTDQGGWADIRNLVFRNFPGPLGSSGPSRFLRLTNVELDVGLYGDGIRTYGSLDSLVLENVGISGDTANGGNLIDIDYAGLVRIDGLIGRNRSGLYIYDVDSIDIRNSDIRTFYQPLYVYGYYGGAQVVQGIYLGDNRFEVHQDEVLSLSDVLRFTSERNTYIGGDVGSYNIIDVEGSSPPRPGSWVIMTQDSVIRRQDVGSYSYSPIYVLDLDTIRLDSVIQVQPDSGMVNYGSVLAGNNIEVLRSVFENQGSSFPFYIDGRNLTVSGSRFTGCRTACGTRYGVELWSYSDSIARVEVSDNTFYQLYRPIQINSSDYVHRVLVTGNTIDSVTQGMNLYGDSITVSDNVITRASSYGIYVSSNSYNPLPYGIVQRNRIFMIGSSGQALEWYNGDLASEGNYYGGTFRGAYVYNSSGVTRTVSLLGDTLLADSALSSRALFITGPWNASVRRNHIQGGEYGLLGDGATTLTLDSNVVTGSSVYGAQVGGSAAYTVTGRWNNFKDNAGSGLLVYGGASGTVTDGRFVGNAGYGVVAGSGTTVDATSNWWGSANGPGGGVADSVSGPGTVNWTPPLGSDPLGTTVPTTPPLALAVPDLWRTPRVRRSGVQSAPSEPDVVQPTMTREQMMALRAEHREAARKRGLEHRAEAERRRQEHRPQR
jgi:hypothetical protein